MSGLTLIIIIHVFTCYQSITAILRQMSTLKTMYLLILHCLQCALLPLGVLKNIYIYIHWAFKS